jgi:leukotriene-A4 hydrolase
LQAFAQHAKHPELTKLRTHLTGVDPDEAFSQVPYEKGYLFLKALEAAAGHDAFDELLTAWLGAHRFGAVTTDDFIATVERVIPGLLAKVDAKTWIDGPGLPATFWKPESARLAAVQKVAGRVPTKDETNAWTATEWQLYLEAMPKPSPVAMCEELDAKYALTGSKNPEVLVAWLVLACESGYAAALPRTEEVLGQIGRMKYLKPLYRALAGRSETKALARELFARFRSGYHPIAQQGLRGVVG